MSITYHNPENLSDWGQSDGWRLLTTEEIKQPLPSDAEFCTTYDGWICSGQRGYVSESAVTYRTKKPLPVSPLISQLDDEIKAKQELKEIALAVEAGAEWEVRCGEGRDCWHKADYDLPWYLDKERFVFWKVRLKPKPVTRDWNKPGDVPWECWLRAKGADDYRVKVIGVNPSGVTALGGLLKPFEPAFESLTWEELAVREYSTGGEWKPCTTEEAK